MKLRQAIKIERNKHRRYRMRTRMKARAVCLRHWWDRRVPMQNYTTATEGPEWSLESMKRAMRQAEEVLGPPPMRLALIDWLYWQRYEIKMPAQPLFIGKAYA